MKTNFWKNITSSIFLILFCLQNSFADDVRLKIPVSSINNIFSAFIESKYFSYGTFTNGGVVTYYSLKPQSISLDVQSGNTFSMTLVADALANFNLVIFDFDLSLPSQSITVTGQVNLIAEGNGYKVKFTPQNIIYNTENWLKGVINAAISGLISKLPEISTSSSQPLLPNIASQYFTSGTPTLTTTSTEIILGLTLVAGPKYITVQNEVNQNNAIGNVQEVVSGNVVGTYLSPKVFDTWNTGDVKQMQTPNDLIASTNGQNKYRNWFKDFEISPQTDIAPRRIQINVGSNDATYTAKFPQAQRVQLSNQLEGNLSGGTVSYTIGGNTTTVPSFDDYDYKNEARAINTSVPNGTLGANWIFQGWNDGNLSQSRNILLDADKNLQAKYKALHASNNASTFSNNSQRKLVQTRDGWLHQVYESMGRVWLEHSTNNGSTWFLGNGGQPLDNGSGKCPSIDWHYNRNAPYNTSNYAVIVVYQQPSGSTYTIEYAVFVNTNGSYVRQYHEPVPLYTEPSGGDPYSINANPNIAWGNCYRFALCFERKSIAGGKQPGIYWRYGNMYESGVEPSLNVPTDPQLLAGTSGSSTNASIALHKGQGVDGSSFDIVYQTGSSYSSDIYDVPIFCYFDGGQWQTTQYANLISSGIGRLNYKPSMVQMDNGNIRVCWIRDVNGDGNTNSPWNLNVVYWDKSTYTYTIMGFKAQSVSLNLRDDNIKSYFAYSNYSYSSGMINQVSDGTNIYDLNTTGRDIQLSNGPTTSTMSVASFYPIALPYYFQNATVGSSGLSKTTASTGSAKVQNVYGRGIVLNELGFFYSLKSLTVDKSNIRFTEIPDRNDGTDRKTRKQYLTLDSLNTMLVGEPFAIEKGIPFEFCDDGGFIDSTAVKEVLGEKGFITCKLELIDAATGKKLGMIKESRFSASNLSMGNLSTSRLKLSDIGNRNVRVKITVSSNVDSLQGALVNEYGTVNNDILGKLSTEELELDKPEVITEFALMQNYPNPFNPSTIIKYQLPNVGTQYIVSLKIYDMLGRIVATLADGMKEAGNYTATFDGSHLASGIYFARLTATPQDGSHPFVQVMKMLMTK